MVAAEIPDSVVSGIPVSSLTNLLTGWALAGLAVALLLLTRDRAGRLLALYLACTASVRMVLPLRLVVEDPGLAQAISNTAFLPFYFAPATMLLFAMAYTGLPRAAWARGPLAAAALAALPAGMAALEVLAPSPFWVLGADGVLLGGPAYPIYGLNILYLTLAFVATVGLLAASLARETDPSAVPSKALLLAAFTVPAAALVRGALTNPPRWNFLRMAGLDAPPLLPAEPWATAPLGALLALLPLAVVLRAASARAREAGAAAVALAVMVSAVLGLSATIEEGPTILRWLFFAVLVAYAALRHGLLGARRVSSRTVELPLAAAGFGALAVLFVALLQPFLGDGLAASGGLVLALLAGALMLSLSGATLPGAAERPRYEEERELGQGSRGRAVLALDRRLNRAVVLKRLPPGPAALREARAAARVSHPGLVALHDVVEDAHGASLVLEYLPGGTLEDRLRAGPLAPAEARRIGLELARGLHALHGAGLVHGDVKAANVLFRADGSAALADFGAARVAARDVEATITGLARDPVEGSLAGAAPEALRGAKPDPRGDVYGLGALLFRALAGEPYLRFPPAFEDARAAVLRDPPRLPHPRVPARWEAVLARALAKEPAARFASAAAMAEALERAEG